MRTKRTLLWTILAAISVLVAACGSDSVADEGPRPSLAGTEWVLTSLNGLPPIAGTRVTLRFEPDGQVGGGAGCNSYGGSYALTADTLAFSDMAWTDMACLDPAGVMDQEIAYMQALQAVTWYQMSDRALELGPTEANPTLIFSKVELAPMNPADLVGSAWELTSLNGKPLIAGSTITLAFSSETGLGGHGGCRGYEGTYQASGDTIRVTSLGMLETECADPALQEQEDQYTTLLSTAEHFQLTGDELTILSQRGETMTFRRMPSV